LIGFPVAWIVWFRLRILPAWGNLQVRKDYPRMMAGAQRLKKFGESYTWYMPLIMVQGCPYIVVGYERGNILQGLATIDENGQFIGDEDLALKLIRCYKLASSGITIAISIDARTYSNYLVAPATLSLREPFSQLRMEEAYFRAAGQKMYEGWTNICAFEKDFQNLVTVVMERKTWKENWWLDQGGLQLATISDQQLYEAEGHLANFDKTMLSYREKIDQVAEDAQVLQMVLPKLPNPWITATGVPIHLNHRPAIEELLKSLVALQSICHVWQPSVIDFIPRTEEWQLWQGRKDLAKKLKQKENI
jgi:hypothetical protein